MQNVNPRGDRAGGLQPADAVPRGFTSFQGAVAVVTGGSSGIGLGIGTALAARGCQVVLCARDAAKVRRAADTIGAMGLAVDVTDRDAMAGLARIVLERFGKVNLLFNNAGVGPAAPFADLQASDWRWMLDVNLWGVLNGLEAFLPAVMAAPEGGAIVNTASQAVFGPVPGLAAYRASKAAVLSLTESLRMELAMAGANIVVSALLPGPVHSEMKSSLRHRPDRGALADIDIRDWFTPEQFIDPATCADMVIRAISQNEPYVVTHPQLAAPWEQTRTGFDAAFDLARARALQNHYRETGVAPR